jgi:hypothetical protein
MMRRDFEYIVVGLGGWGSAAAYWISRREGADVLGLPLGYHGPALEGLAFLQKPYSLATVTARVREALDAPPGA